MTRNALLVSLGACALLALAPLPLRAQEPSLAGKVEEIMTAMSHAQGTAVWDRAMALEALGAEAAPEIATRLEATSGAAKVAAAKAILALGVEAQRSSATQALKDVVRGSTDQALRIRAADLLAIHANRAEIRPLQRDLDRIRDPLVKISVLKALRARGRIAKAERALRAFLKSEDYAVQCAAALALAEIGNVEVGKQILAKLKDEPTERGRRAKAFLELEDRDARLERYGGLEERDEILQMRQAEIDKLRGEVAKLQIELRQGGGDNPAAAGGDTPGSALFGELFRKIQETYVDADKTKTEDLIDAAASGLVDHLDPFSSYMSEKSLTEFNSSIRQRYGGIGAVVQMDRRSGYLMIQRPIYGNPAYEVGLRTLDKITKVEGKSTKDKTVQDLVKVLKGPEDTKVTIICEPFFGGPEREVVVTRKQVTLKSVTSSLLPGNIGYVQLGQFGHLATLEVEQALVELESKGMQGLIFDLRGNPGGLLSAAVEIADKFLEDDDLVVYSEGRKGTDYGARQEDGGPSVRRRRLQQEKHPDYPLIVLVDENSASASEIVSGALQAHGRAELVGRRTFGKGSVQNIFPLKSMNERAALRMTIAYYYLPDGRLIHRPRDVESWRFRQRMRAEIQRWQQDGQINETQAKELLEAYQPQPGGVEPDYDVEIPDFDDAKLRAYGLVTEQAALEAYIKAHWKANQELFHQLAAYDGFDTGRYPEFEALWTKVSAPLDEATLEAFDKNDLRRLLRAMVRRFAQDDQARVLTGDFQEDPQLQAAILLMCERIGTEAAQVPQFSFIGERFPEGVARTRKLEESPNEEKERNFK